MRTHILLFSIALFSGCSDAKKRDKGEVPGEGGIASAQADADALGKEIFDLVDRAMSYRSAHRGRLPSSLKELGIDALTPKTSRTLTVSGDVPDVSVQFRATANHMVSSCHATNSIIEESSLGGGQFSLDCTLVSGGTTTLRTSR